MQQTHRLFFNIMEIAQKWHNAHMTGRTMDEQTAKADGMEILTLAREIINQNDETDRTILNDSLDAQFDLVNLIADNALDYLPDGQTKPDLNYSEISANNSKEIYELCEKIALWIR